MMKLRKKTMSLSTVAMLMAIVMVLGVLPVSAMDMDVSSDVAVVETNDSTVVEGESTPEEALSQEPAPLDEQDGDQSVVSGDVDATPSYDDEAVTMPELESDQPAASGEGDEDATTEEETLPEEDEDVPAAKEEAVKAPAATMTMEQDNPVSMANGTYTVPVVFKTATAGVGGDYSANGNVSLHTAAGTLAETATIVVDGNRVTYTIQTQIAGMYSIGNLGLYNGDMVANGALDASKLEAITVDSEGGATFTYSAGVSTVVFLDSILTINGSYQMSSTLALVADWDNAEKVDIATDDVVIADGIYSVPVSFKTFTTVDGVYNGESTASSANSLIVGNAIANVDGDAVTYYIQLQAVYMGPTAVTAMALGHYPQDTIQDSLDSSKLVAATINSDQLSAFTYTGDATDNVFMQVTLSYNPNAPHNIVLVADWDSATTAETVPDMGTAPEDSTTLKDGTYSVPVSVKMYQGISAEYTTDSSDSMANEAVSETATVTIENGEVYYTLQFSGMYVSSLYGHLLQGWYYPETAIEDGNLDSTNEIVSMDVISTMVDRDLYGNDAEFAEFVGFAYDGGCAETIFIRVYVDAMGAAHQNAVLLFDWDNATEVEQNVEPDSIYSITKIGAETAGGAGVVREITTDGTDGNQYLVVQITEGTGAGATVSVVMVKADDSVVVSYKSHATILAWITDGMPMLSGNLATGVTVYDVAESN